MAIKELKINREFDSPIELVWKAWTDPKIIKKWWGPRGITNPVCEWDPKPNGKINIVMEAGKEMGNFAGQKWPMEGKFIEVKPKRKLVFTNNAIDDVQEIMIESTTTVEFEAIGQKTKMKINIAVTKATKKADMALKGMEMGWNQQIDKLTEELQRMK